MAILDVLTVPNPILTQPTVPVTRFDDHLKKLINDMFDTMRKFHGVGLAAPQVGILDALFVASFEGRDLILVNPKIIRKEGDAIVAEEGCLSIPNYSQFVKRPEKITIEAMTPDGVPITLEEDGFFARIIQHETDHLNGILITDYPSEQEPK